MAVTSEVSSVKVVLKMTEGSQTISGCIKTATDAQLYALGKAVSALEKESVESVKKVIQSDLVEEAE